MRGKILDIPQDITNDFGLYLEDVFSVKYAKDFQAAAANGTRPEIAQGPICIATRQEQGILSRHTCDAFWTCFFSPKAT